MSSLSKGHGLHLLAAHRALLRHLEEIERAAVRGRAPGGQSLSPLPPELWAELEPLLQKMGALSEAIARRHAPDSMHSSTSAQPVSATLRLVSLLLRRLEENLEDLDPDAIARKFGPFPAADEQEHLRTDVETLRADLEQAQSLLEAFRAR